MVCIERTARAPALVIIFHLVLVAAVSFAQLREGGDSSMLHLQVEDIGTIPIALNDSFQSAATLKALAAAGTSGKVHRAESLPSAGSNGPPYALVQFQLSGLEKLAHEGTAKITRGAVCHIGGTSDLFVSLARGKEHDGWEQSMTIVGQVPEPELSALVEGAILARPKHNFTHPNYGTVMSMLDKELPCKLTLAQG